MDWGQLPNIFVALGLSCEILSVEVARAVWLVTGDVVV